MNKDSNSVFGHSFFTFFLICSRKWPSSGPRSGIPVTHNNIIIKMANTVGKRLMDCEATMINIYSRVAEIKLLILAAILTAI